jgi:integrase
MTNDTRQFLKTMLLPKEGLMFKYRNYNGLRSFWQRLMVKLNMNYSLHQLRKTRGTELANLGVNALFLQQFMRHTSFTTTQQYYILVDIKMAAKDINLKLKKVAHK